MERYTGLLGMASVILIAFALSNNRRKINWRTVIVGLLIQFSLGLLLLKIPVTAQAFEIVTMKVKDFLALADVGTAFVWGPLSEGNFVFIINVTGTIIFFSAFISIMYYLGIVQIVINGIAKVMRLLMGTSGSETLSCSANIFVGQTEAPLLIRPFLKNMTHSELNAVMIGGFATIAGGVLAAYIGFGIPANHLIIASVMAAPCALVIAKILVPETEHSETAGDAAMPRIDAGDNILDAAAKGTSDGLKLSLNVVAMLISFIALIALVDWILSGLDVLIDHRLFNSETLKTVGEQTEYVGYFPGSLQTIFGTLFAPLAFILGVPWKEAPLVGNFIGTKICVNEFVAYASLSPHAQQFELLRDLVNQMAAAPNEAAAIFAQAQENIKIVLSAEQQTAAAQMMAQDGILNTGILKTAISEKALVIATYALCGFANFSSIGIQIGGISALEPGRRSDLARLGLRAMIGGVLVSCMTASIAGILL